MKKHFTLNFNFGINDYFTGILIIIIFPFFDFGQFLSNLSSNQIVDATVVDFVSVRSGSGRSRSYINYPIVSYIYNNEEYETRVTLVPYTEIDDQVELLVGLNDEGALIVKPITFWSIYLSVNFFTIIAFLSMFLWLGMYRFSTISNRRAYSQFHQLSHFLYYNNFILSAKQILIIRILFFTSIILFVFNFYLIGLILFLISIYGFSISRTICVDCKRWEAYDGYGFLEYPLGKMKQVSTINQIKIERIENQFYLFLELDNYDYCIYNSMSESDALEKQELVKRQLNEYL